MFICLIALGSNARRHNLSSALILDRALCALSTVGEVRAVSSVYRSPAWPDPAGPPYVNAAVSLSTALPAAALLLGLHAIEAGFGRIRSSDPVLRYAPRPLDLDLIDYDGQRVDDVGLVLPHPRAHERAFVLAPLRDVAPDWRHPVTGKSVGTMLGAAGDRVDRLPFTGAFTGAVAGALPGALNGDRGRSRGHP